MQVLYNAQMIRTWSLLLRNAQRLGYIVSGRQVSKPSSPSVGSVRFPCGMVHGDQQVHSLYPQWTHSCRGAQLKMLH